jgi:hypothetical protein
MGVIIGVLIFLLLGISIIIYAYHPDVNLISAFKNFLIENEITKTPLADAYLKYGYANVTTKCIDPGTIIRIPSSDNDEIDKALQVNNLSLKMIDAEGIKEMSPEQIGEWVKAGTPISTVFYGDSIYVSAGERKPINSNYGDGYLTTTSPVTQYLSDDDLKGDEQYMTEGTLKKLFEKGRLPLQQKFKR